MFIQISTECSRNQKDGKFLFQVDDEMSVLSVIQKVRGFLLQKQKRLERFGKKYITHTQSACLNIIAAKRVDETHIKNALPATHSEIVIINAECDIILERVEPDFAEIGKTWDEMGD